MRIAEELRCLVCQNETIAASHADLAVDLRKQIRQKLQQGQSQEQILDFMVQRYGDFVLYRPPVKSSTWLLWGGPFRAAGRGAGRPDTEHPAPAQPGECAAARRRGRARASPARRREELSMSLFWAIAAALLLLALWMVVGTLWRKPTAGAQGAKCQPVESGGAEGPAAADRSGPGPGRHRRGAAPGHACRDRTPRARGRKRRRRTRARRFTARHHAAAAAWRCRCWRWACTA